MPTGFLGYRQWYAESGEHGQGALQALCADGRTHGTGGYRQRRRWNARNEPSLNGRKRGRQVEPTLPPTRIQLDPVPAVVSKAQSRCRAELASRASACERTGWSSTRKARQQGRQHSGCIKSARPHIGMLAVSPRSATLVSHDSGTGAMHRQ